MKNCYLYIIFMFSLFAITSCKKRVMPTHVIVEDSIRHYYPMMLNDNLRLSYKLTNIGDEPFVISDIQPSCGCVTADDDHCRIIMPGKSANLNFLFNSAKNRGYVRQYIRIYGNVEPKGVVPLLFDVNVVVQTGAEPDYEEIYKKNSDANAVVGQNSISGRITENGYWVGDSVPDFL